MYLTCQLVVRSICPSPVDSLFDSLQIGNQGPRTVVPGPALNLADVFLQTRTRLQKDQQSHA